jgi:hypothetical protein
VEHRTSPDDLVPPWYKRGVYIIIIALIAFILIYALYILVLSPPQPTPPYVPDNTTGGLFEPP